MTEEIINDLPVDLGGNKPIEDSEIPA